MGERQVQYPNVTYGDNDWVSTVTMNWVEYGDLNWLSTVTMNWEYHMKLGSDHELGIVQ